MGGWWKASWLKAGSPAVVQQGISSCFGSSLVPMVSLRLDSRFNDGREYTIAIRTFGVCVLCECDVLVRQRYCGKA